MSMCSFFLSGSFPRGNQHPIPWKRNPASGVRPV
jgi:hypothetical protein